MRGLRRPLLFASPARRCLSLARTFGGAVTADPRLLELDFGAWEGRRWEEIDRAALDAWAADPCGFTPPGGEPVAALVARVEAFARDLRALGRDAVIVTHGGPLRVLLPVLRRAAPDLLAPAPPFGSVTMIADQPAEAAAASSVSTAHSATCSAAPSTSPV